MAADEPVWVLLGQKTGDNNQLLRLANALGLPFRAIELKYNSRHRLPSRLLRSSLASLTNQSRALLVPPWPRLVLGIGNRSVPAALAIREASGGTSKLVRLGNPRLHPRNFDLVITTPQYRVPGAANLVRLPVGISTAADLDPTSEESEWLERLPRPHRLFLIGGDTFMWQLSPAAVASAAARLAAKAEGSVIAVTSPRSGGDVIDAVEHTAHAVVRDRFPRYPVLLHDADEIHVTGDSVAMISDAVATGKPVGLLLPEKTAAGNLFYGCAQFGLPVPIRDISLVWLSVMKLGLAGSNEQPIAGKLDPEPLETAVEAVRALLR